MIIMVVDHMYDYLMWSVILLMLYGNMFHNLITVGKNTSRVINLRCRYKCG